MRSTARTRRPPLRAPRVRPVPSRRRLGRRSARGGTHGDRRSRSAAMTGPTRRAPPDRPRRGDWPDRDEPRRTTDEFAAQRRETATFPPSAARAAPPSRGPSPTITCRSRTASARSTRGWSPTPGRNWRSRPGEPDRAPTTPEPEHARRGAAGPAHGDDQRPPGPDAGPAHAAPAADRDRADRGEPGPDRRLRGRCSGSCSC